MSRGVSRGESERGQVNRVEEERERQLREVKAREEQREAREGSSGAEGGGGYESEVKALVGNDQEVERTTH